MSKIIKTCRFCSDVELGGFVASIDVVPDAFRAVSETLSSSSSLSYKFHTSSSGIKILAFSCSNDYRTRFLNGGFDLVSSETCKVVDFIGTKVNPSFSINKAAVELFQSLPLELNKDELIRKPLIVTGLSLAGYVAILFTLWLQHAIDVKEADSFKDTKRPICITFGCPLVGNEPLQKAISERPQWKSSFLNVIAKTDPIASFFSSNSPYKPFGTTLFCTESGGHTVFEDQESVLAVLDAMSSSTAGNTEIPDYGNHLKSIRRKVLYRGVSESGELNQNPLRAGIEWQFKQLEVPDSDNLIERTEKKQKEANRKKNMTNAYDDSKKLNDMKISLTYMEWYMKTRRSKGGYYDCHKKVLSQKEIEGNQVIVTHKRKLNQYWEKTVKEKDLMPQKEGAKLRKRWLYGGTNYRRIVEPLEIADYYKKGRKDYLANRSNHFKLLEDWSNDDNKDQVGGRKKAASLTEDSCFWAYVEEALILLNELKDQGSSGNKELKDQGSSGNKELKDQGSSGNKELKDQGSSGNKELKDQGSSGNKELKDQGSSGNKELENFEIKVMGEIKNYSLSPDVFLEGTSFIKWWNEYKQHKGSSYVSEFAQFMESGKYKSYSK